MEKKIVSVNLDVMKEKAVEGLDAVKGKAADAAKAVGARANGLKNKAVASLLDRGIKLSEKQLKALEEKRSKIS